MATASVGHNDTPQCHNCREAGVLKDAISFCSECDRYFCVVCDKLHGKLVPGHKTDPYESVDTAENKVDDRTMYATCSKHSSETINYYCQEHESVICKICKQSEHASCAVQSASDACEGISISTKIADTIKKFINLQQKTDKLKHEVQMELDTYQSDIHARRYDIKRLQKDFNSMFDRYDVQLELQEASFVNSLSSSIRSCVSLTDQVKNQTKFLEETQGTVNEILSFQQLIKAETMYREFNNMFGEIQIKERSCDIKEDKNHSKLLNRLSKLVHHPADLENSADSEEIEEKVTEEMTKTKSFLNISSCTPVTQIDTRVCNDGLESIHYGCCCMLDGQVILCDNYNKKIKILDKNYNIKFTALCPLGPYDVDSVDTKSAVVTLPEAKAIQFISVNPGFKFLQKIQLKLKCSGVCIHDKTIFVCIHEPEQEKRGVKVLNLNGGDMAFIPHLGTGDPRNICVTADGSKVCYTGGSGKDLFINCVTKDGYGIFSVSNSDLDMPRGIIHDEYDNIMICDESKKCLQIISAEGVCENRLLTANNMYAPRSMCLSKTYDYLVVASYEYRTSGASLSKLTVYNLEYS